MNLIKDECRKLGLTTLPATRADLLSIPEINNLGTDSSGLPLAYSNSYHCQECDQSWVDTWSCAADDDCPECGSAISPEASELLIPETIQTLFEILPE